MKLSKNFEIHPLNYAIQRNAILGIPNSGKTYTALKIAEELLTAGVPIIAFDPIGVWRNLKKGINGHPGFPIVVAGGNEPDVPLTTDNVQDIVLAALKENVSLVIDLYCVELSQKSKWLQIVEKAVHVLLYENSPHGIRHIFIEEAAEFIPQRVQPQHGKVYAKLESLARIGRNAKLGYTIINQRAEEVNKAILELSACSFLHKQTGRNSLSSIKKWLALSGIENEKTILKSLPKLGRGDCWVIGENEPFELKVEGRKTFHPNPSDPLADESKAIKKIDVSAFVSKLNKQLVKHTDTTPAKTSGELSDLVAKLAEKERLLTKTFQEIREKDKLNVALRSVINKISALIGELEFESVPAVAESEMIKKVSTSGEYNYEKMKSVVAGASGQMRMLKAASMYGTISRARMATLARLSPKSGSFNTYLSELKRKGYLEGDKDAFSITAEGRKAAGDVPALPSDPKQLVEMWCEVLGVSSGSARILRHLAGEYPRAVGKAKLGSEVGLSFVSGSFNTYISTLKRNGLIEVGPTKDYLCAAQNLMKP